MVFKRSWAGEVRNVSVLAAIGVGTDGHRQILGVAEGQKEDLEGRRGFLRHLKDRGLRKTFDTTVDEAAGGGGDRQAPVTFPETIVHDAETAGHDAPKYPAFGGG